MKIAVTYAEGEIFQHFGKCEEFKIYDVEDGKVCAVTVVEADGAGHGALADFLEEQQVEVLICGGIGMGAQTALSEAGIRLCAGVQGSADEAAAAFVNGTLVYDPAASCDHHDHHHGEGHECSHHEDDDCRCHHDA